MAHQIRIRGKAYLLSPPSSSNGNAAFPYKRLGPKLAASGSKSTFDWEAERQRIFGKMSEKIKASFLRPTPGTLIADINKDMSDFPEELGNDADETQIKTAMENFSLIAIEADEVDAVDLKKTPNERVLYRKKTDGTWMEEAVAP